MSSVVISGDTSGAITLSAPAVAGTNTITLPAATGTVVLTGTTPTLNGITFPATQVPSADANTLDDYEEGTWTPSVGGNATYVSGNAATYIKIGKMVTVNFDLQISVLGTGSTTSINNFPFVSDSSGFPRAGCCSYYATLSISPIFIAFYLSNNSTACAFVWNTVGSATVGFNSAALFTNNSRITGSITYTASA